MDMTSLIGFTFGDLGSVRDRQTTSADSSTCSARYTSLPRSREHFGELRIGEYVIDYSPLSPGDLDDAGMDAELEAMLAASTVVHRNEGV